MFDQFIIFEPVFYHFIVIKAFHHFFKFDQIINRSLLKFPAELGGCSMGFGGWSVLATGSGGD